MKKLFIVVLIISSVMFVTNPSEADFKVWFGDQVEAVLDDGSRDDGLLGSINNLIAKTAASVIVPLYTRRDYKIFCVYEIDMFGIKEYVLGFFGRFVCFDPDTPGYNLFD